MERITIKHIRRVLNLINKTVGDENAFCIEQGNAYVSWKFCAGPRGSRTILSCKTARELFNEMHAFRYGLEFAAERNAKH